MLRYLILAAFIPAIFATEGLQTCAAGHEFPLEVTVDGCAQAPCDIQLGTDAAMRIVFQADRDIVTFRPDTVAFLGTIPVPYPLPEDTINRACSDLEGAECPIPAGTVVIYNFRLPVGPNYPTIAVNVELSLFDHDNDRIVCVRVPINAVA